MKLKKIAIAALAATAVATSVMSISASANNHYDINKQYTTCQYQRTFFLTGNGLSSFHYPPQRTPYPGMNRNAEP